MRVLRLYGDNAEHDVRTIEMTYSDIEAMHDKTFIHQGLVSFDQAGMSKDTGRVHMCSIREHLSQKTVKEA